jgi:acyl carrier protein
MSLSTELTTFIETEITPGRGFGPLAPEDDLLACGIIDSLGVAQLQEFIEGRFGIRIGEDDLVPANFQTVRSIEDFIARKRGLRVC